MNRLNPPLPRTDHSPARRRSSFLWVAIPCYLLAMTLLIWGLQQARQWALGVYSTAGAQQDWQSFRDDVAVQERSGSPVRRRVPKSGEPPALVLLRDHFLTTSAIAGVLCSALYWTLAVFLVGAVRGEDPANSSDSVSLTPPSGPSNSPADG